MVELVEHTPEVADLVDLYASVGWSAYADDPATLHRGIAASGFVVAAWLDGQLIGLLRAISDDATVAYLQDVLVRPAAQRQGVGRRLVEAFLARYDHVRQRVLLTDDQPGQRAFYESLGFTRADLVHGGPLRAFVDLRD